MASAAYPQVSGKQVQASSSHRPHHPQRPTGVYLQPCTIFCAVPAVIFLLTSPEFFVYLLEHVFFIENDFRTNFIVTTKSKRIPAIDNCFSTLPLFAQSKPSHGISEIFKQQVGAGSISEITDFIRQIANAINQRF
jgi:hypothetical protein